MRGCMVVSPGCTIQIPYSWPPKIIRTPPALNPHSKRR
nr:MAG TPA: 39S ribosomal protein L2 [Caudoviricetes sp.]